MILTQCELRRHRSISRRLVIGIVLILSPLLAGLCSDWDREGAKRAWNEAGRLRETLTTSSTPSRESYLKCIRTYQQVYLKDPHYGYSASAVYEAAKLYQELGEKFDDLSYYRSAARLYRFLTTDYGTSPFCPDALLRLGTISESRLGDVASAQDAYEKLRTRYKFSPAAAALIASSKKEGIKPVPPSIPAQAATTPSPPVSVGSSGKKTEGPLLVKNLLFRSNRNDTRVSIVSDGEVRYLKNFLSNPARLFFDITDARLDRNLLNRTIAVNDRFLKTVRLAQNRLDVVRVVLDFNGSGDFSITDVNEAFGIRVDISEKGMEVAPAGQSKGQIATASPPSVKIQEPSPARAKAEVPVVEVRAAAVVPPHAAESKLNAAPSVVPISESIPLVVPQKQERDTQPEAVASLRDGLNRSAAGVAKESKSSVIPDSLPPPKTALPTSNGDRTLTRMLGLKIGRIVLDPGHGGYDTGTIGPSGLMEKDLVLQVARELKKLLEQRLAAEVILTRDDDTFISLEERTAIANQNKADLFVSIHANSSTSRNTSGVETYFLDFARTDSAREVAARENATTDHNIRDLQNLIRMIAQADKMEESKELAAIIQKNLFNGVQKLIPASQNRGVRSAPFVVLIGANMPSVLAELSFISNPRDERLLKKEVSRQSLADSLFLGIQGYMKTLGTGVAQNRGNSN